MLAGIGFYFSGPVDHGKRLLRKYLFPLQPNFMESKNKLQSSEWILLLQGFTQWLELLGYSPLSIPGLKQSLQYFLIWLQQGGKTALTQLVSSDGPDYMAHLQTLVGVRTKRPFSNKYLNKQVQALKLFSDYLRETGRSHTAFLLTRLPEHSGKPSWLTKAEIQALYEATAGSVLGLRDRAMLAVFYGCGLRLNEGASLEIKDILESRKLLHVRKGKHYKERLVPIAEKSWQTLTLYLQYARPQLLQATPTEAVFIDAQKGRPLHKQSLYLRIKALAKKAKIKKKVGTHTLRHSIATHLLQSGMKLERIQQFLGHGSLDSTQIYTHLKNETL
jgi:integrase/recombinase XerD